MLKVAQEGWLVYGLNRDIHVRTTTSNVDLVLGRPAESTLPGAQLIAQGRPATIQIAMEFKAIMTEHGKARKNRKRDLEAHHELVHSYNPDAIAAGVFVVNQSPRFKSPLRSNVTIHGSIRRSIQTIVESTITELREVSERRNPGGTGMDAKCAIVVNMDNINVSTTSFVEQRPAPLVGDPLNYESFIQRVCELYRQRFTR